MCQTFVLSRIYYLIEEVHRRLKISFIIQATAFRNHRFDVVFIDSQSEITRLDSLIVFSPQGQ